MYEDLAKTFCDYSDQVVETTQTVPVPKRDLQQVYVAIAKLNDKIMELESQTASLRRQAHDLLKENNNLAQDFYYLLQQVDGLPPHAQGLSVRLPGCFLPQDDEGGVWGTRYAVLHPERDPAAKAALYAYASATANAMIRHKILLWLGDETPADEPVTVSAVDIIGEALAAREKRLAMEQCHGATA